MTACYFPGRCSATRDNLLIPVEGSRKGQRAQVREYKRNVALCLFLLELHSLLSLPTTSTHYVHTVCICSQVVRAVSSQHPKNSNCFFHFPSLSTSKFSAQNNPTTYQHPTLAHSPPPNPVPHASPLLLWQNSKSTTRVSNRQDSCRDDADDCTHIDLESESPIYLL